MALDVIMVSGENGNIVTLTRNHRDVYRLLSLYIDCPILSTVTIPPLKIRTAFYWLAMLVSTAARVCAPCGSSLIPLTKNEMLNPYILKTDSCFYLRSRCSAVENS